MKKSLLICAESGAGKTTSIACLKDQPVTVLDFESGSNVLANQLSESDKMKIVGCYDTHEFTVNATSEMRNKRRTALTKIKELKALETMTQTLNKVTNDPNHIVVVDTLTALGAAYLRRTCHLAGRTIPQLSDYNDPASELDVCVSVLCSHEFQPSVVCLTHINYIQDEKDTGKDASVTPVRGYPNAVGKKLSYTLGRHFNNIFAIKAFGSKRTFVTEGTEAGVHCKSERKFPELLVENGLRVFFNLEAK